MVAIDAGGGVVVEWWWSGGDWWWWWPSSSMLVVVKDGRSKDIVKFLKYVCVRVFGYDYISRLDYQHFLTLGTSFWWQ